MNCKLCEKYIATQLVPWEIILWQPLKKTQLCRECWQSFTKINYSKACQICGKKENYKVCKDCQLWQTTAEYPLVNQSLYCYDALMKKFMQKYKFEYDLELAEVFKSEFTQFLKITNNALVIPIPQRAQKRKFNQVRNLMKNNKRIKNSILFVKKEAIDKLQVNLNRQERLQTRQPFDIDKQELNKVQFERIILIDDIYTTGRTLRHAANLLAQYTTKPIIAKTLAR
ncbi:competence protein ComFC [Weissella beninensis]|uniref:ComF family protein n=1 Tax=Periweissella beninensis TaxID=504936 RepID=A0ABT0VJH6_9LACO|nr:phosphoribosyltransferase family protein [Periweissella beninensis]MBM7544413.1 competence protein ComFC [Periweissella beninensis]MCM2437821.1 ComF family protein [Periweissella beninensis]